MPQPVIVVCMSCVLKLMVKYNTVFKQGIANHLELIFTSFCRRSLEMFCLEIVVFLQTRLDAYVMSFRDCCVLVDEARCLRDVV